MLRCSAYEFTRILRVFCIELIIVGNVVYCMLYCGQCIACIRIARVLCIWVSPIRLTSFDLLFLRRSVKNEWINANRGVREVSKRVNSFNL